MFASVELAVGICFASMLEPAPRQRSIAAINAARSFEAKLKLVDATAAVSLNDAMAQKWRSLSSKVSRRKNIRDKLAHWTVSHWPGANSIEDMKNWKPALVPPIWSKKYAEVMWLPQNQRNDQPIFLDQLNKFHEKTLDLFREISEFSNEIADCSNRESHF